MQIMARGEGMPIMKRLLCSAVAVCSLACTTGPSAAFQTGEEFDAFQRKLSPTNTMICPVRWSDMTGQPSQPGEEAMPFGFSYIDGELWFRGVNAGRPNLLGEGQGQFIVASVDQLLERFGGRLIADQLASRGGDPERRSVALVFEGAAAAIFFTMGVTKSVDQGQVVYCERYAAP